MNKFLFIAAFELRGDKLGVFDINVSCVTRQRRLVSLTVSVIRENA